jgi:VanZ family protein
MRAKILKKINLWLPLVIWASIIFFLSNHRLTPTSQIYWQDFIFKKSAHMFFYGVFAILSFRAVIGEGVKKMKSFYVAVLMAFLYGITDEFHQSFIFGREPTVRDVIIDTIGASIASFLLYYLVPKLPKDLKIFLEKLGIN